MPDKQHTYQDFLNILEDETTIELAIAEQIDSKAVWKTDKLNVNVN